MNRERSENSLQRLISARRVVIKIGSALLVDHRSGCVRRHWMDSVASDVVRLRERGTEVVLVSSGAVAVGRRRLHLLNTVLRLEEKQAAAAVGQVDLAHAYQEVLGEYGLAVGQILLTLDDTENRRRYLNARSTLDTLLKLGAVPLINENDTVATEEIRYGDNDRLGARVALCVNADVLVLLSDIDGLYTADPKIDPTARRLREVTTLTPDIWAMAGDVQPGVGTGGMVTKMMAAQISTGAGCAMVIAPGKDPAPIKALEEGGACTWFLAETTPQSARKQWIFGAMQAGGTVRIDGGAERALLAGRSLLPAGVVGIEGDFARGDTVLVGAADGRVLGKGLTAYGASEARRIMGHKSVDIETILGYQGREEIIHRDNLVMT